MSEWVKVHVSLLNNVLFRRLSERAKLTFYGVLVIAKRENREGALATRLGPLTIAEIAHDTGVPERLQEAALRELVHADFLTLGPDGAFIVNRFSEKAGAKSTERVRRFREKQRETHETRFGNADETRNGNALDTEREEEKETEVVCTARERDAAPLDDDDDFGGGAVRTHGDAAAMRQADEFGSWFHEEGQKAGAIGEHVLYPGSLGERDLRAAMVLLATYALDEIKAKALAMFAWRMDRRDPMTMAVTIANLEKHWSQFRVRRETAAKVVPISSVAARLAQIEGNPC